MKPNQKKEEQRKDVEASGELDKVENQPAKEEGTDEVTDTQEEKVEEQEEVAAGAEKAEGAEEAK